MTDQGWIGVDLDGTLAAYTGWQGVEHIGDPIPVMVKRVKAWLATGKDVRIFTARVHQNDTTRDLSHVRQVINDWCLKHIGAVLPVTNSKDYGMVELWDDRCVQVEANTGRRMDGEGCAACDGLPTAIGGGTWRECECGRRVRR
jgi:hypothetical protein